MLGLFQGDLPIGRRLWPILLALVVSGALASEIITFSQDPVQFTIQTLLLFGYIFAISLIITFCIFLILDRTQKIIDERATNRNNYRTLIEKDLIDIWGSSVVNLAYIASIFIGIAYYDSERVRSLGILGLIFLLLMDIVDNLVFQSEVFEIIELQREPKEKIWARLLSQNRLRYIFFLSSDWAKEISYLMSQGWEVIEISSNEETPYALLRRVKIVSRIDQMREERKERKRVQQSKDSKDEVLLQKLLQWP